MGILTMYDIKTKLTYVENYFMWPLNRNRISCYFKKINSANQTTMKQKITLSASRNHFFFSCGQLYVSPCRACGFTSVCSSHRPKHVNSKSVHYFIYNFKSSTGQVRTNGPRVFFKIKNRLFGSIFVKKIFFGINSQNQLIFSYYLKTVHHAL